MKFYFKSFGCKTNQIELESIVEKLISNGLKMSEDDYDILIINSCCVTKKAEDEEISFIRKIRLKKKNVKIIITGCFATLFEQKLKDLFPDITVYKNKDKYKIVSDILNKNIDFDYFTVSGFYGKTRAFIKVQDGCNLKCSYCIVPYARNDIYSKPYKKVIEEIKNLIDNGYKEIVFSGTRLGSYKDEDKNLVHLIKEISNINANFRVRLSSLEPMEITRDLLDIISNNEKFCNYLHIPLQSGCDRMLKTMNRPYDKEFFYKKIEMIKEKIKDVGIYLDVIVGFADETEKDFNETVEFINQIQVSGLHVFTYSKRPFTKAWDMADLPLNIKNERSKYMHIIDRELRYKFKKSMIDKKLKILTIKQKDNKTYGLTSNFIDVIINKKIKTNEFIELCGYKIEDKYLLCR